MSTRRRTVIAIVMMPLALLLALGSIGLASAHPAGSLATHAVALNKPTITIHSFAFTTPAKVMPGARIKVVNKDAVAHTVTADAGAFDVAVPANTTVTFRAPKTSGSYPFHCSIHLSMKSTLVVK